MLQGEIWVGTESSEECAKWKKVIMDAGKVWVLTYVSCMCV